MPQGDTLQVQDILNRAFDSTLNALKVAGGGGVSQFVSTIHNIVGGNGDAVRLLWTPSSGDTTTATSKDKDQRTITWDATVASRLTALGGGLAQDFDGTNDEGDIPDNDDFSYGDGATDEPFSVVALVNPDGVASGSQVLVTKYDTGNSIEEWRVRIDIDEKAFLECWDASASAQIRRKGNTAYTVGSWGLFGGTYDGSAAITGIRLYKDGSQDTTTDDGAGSYTAMENLTAKVYIGAEENSGTAENFFNGKMAFILIVATQLSEDQMWSIKEAVNAFFNLSL